MIKIRLRTKHGKPFRRFGVLLGPEQYTDLEVTQAQFDALAADCAPLDKGGVLELKLIETTSPAATASGAAAAVDGDGPAPAAAPADGKGKGKGRGAE